VQQNAHYLLIKTPGGIIWSLLIMGAENGHLHSPISKHQKKLYLLVVGAEENGL